MLNNDELSRWARGLLAYMLSKPDNRSFNNTDLIKRSKRNWKTALEWFKKELKDLKYLIISQNRKSSWMIEYERYVADTPYTDFPSTVKPWTVHPCTVNEDYSNTDISNTDIVLPKGNTNQSVWTEDLINQDTSDEWLPPPGSATPPPQKFGNKDINELIEKIKEKIAKKWLAYNKTREREFARWILEAQDYWDFCESIGRTREQFALDIIDVAIGIKYYIPVNWPMSIYKHYADIYTKRKIQTIDNDPIKDRVKAITDTKLQQKILIELESRKQKNLSITVDIIDRIEQRLLSSK